MISIARQCAVTALRAAPGPRAACAAALAAALCACVAPAREPGAPAPDAAQSSALALPAGPGREILERDCTGCHDLDGLSAYRGYYDAARWRAMIVTMIDHGADLDEDEVAVLTGYLAEHFGPGSP